MRHFWGFLLGLFLTTLAFSQDAPNQMLIVVRHGEAVNNTEAVYNSNPDHPNYMLVSLTAKGKKQVANTAQDLLTKGFNKDNIVAVYVSPLPRAIQTADVLAQAGLISRDKIMTDKRLIEIQVGDLEGKPVFPTWEPSYTKKYHAETAEHLMNRVQDFYSSILKLYPTGNILVVTHAMPANDLIEIASGQQVAIGTGDAIVVPLRKSEPSE